VQQEAPGKPSVWRMASLDAELVTYLVERGQVSFLVHHCRPASKGGKKAPLTSNPTLPCRSGESRCHTGNSLLQSRTD